MTGGGLRLETNKERSTAAPLRAASVPAEVILPLDQHAGTAARPLVKVGDAVLLGQPIAEPTSDISAWVHSPVSGSVIAVEPRPVAYHAASSPCIVIRNDFADRRDNANTAVDYASMSPAQLSDHIARGGIVGLGGATFPTASKLSQAVAQPDLHLLLNGAECEPWISCDDMLMRERAADIVFGAHVLMHALGTVSCTIAVEDDVPQAIASLRAAAAQVQPHIRIATLPDVYPAGGERQLILAVTDREVPAGRLPSDIGILCQNVGTAAAVARWIRDGEPLITRIVTITGSGVREPANLETRLGTPIASLIADCGGYTTDDRRLIMGGSMMGLAFSDDRLPIVKGSNCVIVPSPSDLHPRSAEMPCIRCGNCSEVCPAWLLPQQLHWQAQAHDVAALESFGLMDCIECGCCDYVCPSQIPLTQRFREAKVPVQAELLARSEAHLSRQRYEARGERLVRIENEQRARLEQKRREITGRKSPP